MWGVITIPKRQRCNGWSLGIGKLFQPTLYWICDYLSLLRLNISLNLNHAQLPTHFQGCLINIGGNALLCKCHRNDHESYGLLTRYVKLRVAHAPGMPGTFSPPSRVSDLDMHHGTCVTHVPWCMPGSLTSGFLWSRWRGKHSRRMRDPPFYVSGKRPIVKQSISQTNQNTTKSESCVCHWIELYIRMLWISVSITISFSRL